MRLASTDYGRRFGVSRDWSYEEFAAEIPPADYEDLQPFLAYSGGLLNERVRVWEPTGGSTGGSKWIPWTASLQAEFRRAVAAWIGQMFWDRPALKIGRGYWQFTPKASLERPDWLGDAAAGFESDGEYLGRLGRLLENWITIRPGANPGDFWPAVTQAVRTSPDLALISCWSPSFLLLLREHMGCWEPRKWWPNLQVVSCWTKGPSAPFLPKLEELFPGAEIRGKGLLSTEAVTTIPLGGRYPLAYRSHFFEFLSDDGAVLPAWSVEKGGCYRVLQTTGGGLTRYRSGDRVRVNDFFGAVPCFEFLGRERASDHFGEKLDEAFVQNILNAERRFALLGFEENGYVLFLEESNDVEECRERVSRALRESFTYRDCLHLGQLRELRAFVVQGDALEQIHRHGNLRHGTLKPRPFLPDGVWSERLKGEFEKRCRNA